jgi:tyrosinase
MPRKRHDQVTADEWREFLEAFEVLHTLDAPFPRHLDFFDAHVRMFEAHCSHGFGHRRHPHFLPWHRHLLWRFERALQEVRRGVIIPYWDFYTDPAIPAALDDPKILERWRVTRNFRFHEMPCREYVDVVRSQKRFDVFQRLVEATIHADVMAAVGGVDAHGCPGTMATSAATRDPLFWVHLANLDRLWAEFQTRCPQELPKSGRELLEPGPLFGVHVQTVLTINTLGYAYA